MRRPILTFAAALLLAAPLAAPLAAQKQPVPGGEQLGSTKSSSTTRRAVPGASDALPGQSPTPNAQSPGCPPEPGNRSICFSRIEAQYDVLRSGDVMVTETFTVRFNGDWNGMTRELVRRATEHDSRPASERDPNPDRSFREVDIEVLGATDDAGNELEIEEEGSGEYRMLKIWVPGANDAERTVVLRYRIDDGVTFYDDHDEFYWNVLGSTSTAPVARMDVRVGLPEVTGLHALAFAGTEGSGEQNATVGVEGTTVNASSTTPLGPGLGFTVVAGWDTGVIARPGAVESFMDWLRRYWAFVLPPLSLGLMWSQWRRRGRDPEMRSIVTQYEVPGDVSPGEVGTMLDERADMRDVTATLVDLAVQGRLRIDETEGTKVLGMEFGESYRFVETTPDPAGRVRPLRPHEAKLLSALFSGRSQVDLSDLKNEFYKDLPGIRESMMDCLISQGVYTKRPDRARAGWVVGGIVLGIALFFLLGFIGRTHPAAILLVPPLTALPVIVFGWLMPARTEKGTRLIEKLRGFKEFLSRVDGDRLRRMNIEPSAFEKMLPFAMALGVEKKWGEAFEGLAQEPPRWYHTRNGRPFHPAVFTSDLGRMSTQTATMMSSSPKSSGGSGFGGGGSVGGGGGGGGVGGF